MSSEIGLSEFITRVKEDLKPTQESPIFFLEEVELEIHVAVSKQGSLGGEIKGKADLKINVLGFDFLKLGEGGVGVKTFGELQRQDVHTIKVTLTPIFTKKEIMATFGEEELSQIREGIKKKIMRGGEREEGTDLDEVQPKNEAASRKVVRG